MLKSKDILKSVFVSLEQRDTTVGRVISNEGLGNGYARLRGLFTKNSDKVSANDYPKWIKAVHEEITRKYGNAKWLESATWNTDVDVSSAIKNILIEGKLPANLLHLIKTQQVELNTFLYQFNKELEAYGKRAVAAANYAREANDVDEYIKRLKEKRAEVLKLPLQEMQIPKTNFLAGPIFKTLDGKPYFDNWHVASNKHHTESIKSVITKDNIKEVISVITFLDGIVSKYDELSDSVIYLGYSDDVGCKFYDELDEDDKLYLWRDLFYYQSINDSVQPWSIYEWPHTVLKGLMSLLKATVK